MLYARSSLTARPVAAPRSSVRIAPIRPSVVVRADPGDELKQGARDVQKNVSRGAEDAKDAVSDAGDKLKSRSDSAADDGEGMLKKAQKNVNRAAEDAKDNVQEGYDAVKKNASEAADNIKEGAKDLGDRLQGKN